MKISALFVTLIGAGALAAAIAGCGASGPVPVGFQNMPPPTVTPAAQRLYADHNGILYEYRLPLQPNSRPIRTLVEWPNLGVAPQVAVDPFGNIAVASTRSIRIFAPPIVSFEPSRAKLKLTLTPAITQIGVSGADLVDIEYDPNQNLWLLNNLGGGGVSELRVPITPTSVAALSIEFGAPGSKTAGFSTLIQARFDINAALYVYASSSTRARVFKTSFPYAKPPSSIGLDVAQADFVDSSQWLPTAPQQPSLILGQYFGALHSPQPGSPPSPPVNVLSQFVQPLNARQQGLFPDEFANTIVGALVADPPRASFYTLDAATGRLDAYGLPMQNHAKPKVSLSCIGGSSHCSHKFEHLFLAP